jgi:hypothetical protein
LKQVTRPKEKGAAFRFPCIVATPLRLWGLRRRASVAVGALALLPLDERIQAVGAFFRI